MNKGKKSLTIFMVMAMISVGLLISPGTYAMAASSPESIELPVTYRDFHSAAWPGSDSYEGHPDFENTTGDDRGIVEKTLGLDKKPVYAGLENNPTTHGKFYFDMWYRNIQAYNMNVPGTIELVRGSDGIYRYASSAFFPLDKKGMDAVKNGMENDDHNYHFTMEMHASFVYQPGQILAVSGDDDIWVFIDNKQVIDLGGVHGEQSVSVTLNNLGLTAGKEYDFDLFFAERHTTESNFNLSANFVLEAKYPTYSLSGYVINDETNAGLSGWAVKLEKFNGYQWTDAGKTLTDAAGKYSFQNLYAGKYRISEAVKDGWSHESGAYTVTCPDKNLLYGIQKTSGKIYEIDPKSPAEAKVYEQIDLALVSSWYASITLNGLAFDKATGDLYFSADSNVNRNSRLYRINHTGQTYVGELTGNAASGDFHDGKYYYIADNTDDLYVVSFKTDGTIAARTKYENITGSRSIEWKMGDIAVDSVESFIYGAGCYLNDSNNEKQEIFKVKLDGTGYERIGEGFTGSRLQLAIGNDQKLYAHNEVTGDFYTVDRVTRKITLVGNGINPYSDLSSAEPFYNFRVSRDLTDPSDPDDPVYPPGYDRGGPGGISGLGFWRNKHGAQAIESIPNVWRELRALNLKDAKGNAFDPKDFAQFKWWLQRANARNMQYMLSANLAIAKLNVLAGFVSANTPVRVNERLDPDKTMTVGELIKKANEALGNPNTDRLKLELFKHALNRI